MSRPVKKWMLLLYHNRIKTYEAILAELDVDSIGWNCQFNEFIGIRIYKY